MNYSFIVRELLPCLVFITLMGDNMSNHRNDGVSKEVYMDDGGQLGEDV